MSFCWTKCADQAKRIDHLESKVEHQEGEIDRLQSRIAEDRVKVAALEGLFMRLGWQRGPNGWEPRRI
jgi:uncharacterized coiled-coil protein SlyX